MNAHDTLLGRFGRSVLRLVTPASHFESDGSSNARRSLVSYFSTLTREQQKAVLAYEGDDTLGDPADFEHDAPELKMG